MSVLNKVNVISSIGYDCKICQKLSHEGQESIAGVFSTYAHSWLTSGPELFVVNNSDGVLQSYWTFGENLQDDLEITCAVELPLEGCAIPLLILGISSENVNLICFFNPNTRKILRTIDIIYPVRTICVIEDGTNEVCPLNDTLTPTEGLIAVGCAEGTILLIDLCRSILCKAVNGDFRFYSTEENPSETVYIGMSSVTSGGLSQKIVENRKKKNCISVILTESSEDGITALLYSIESAVLFVGTSSGSFHLWNMSSLSCLYKSPGTNRAIISLSLLEPCDDPRHNLYLWICFEEYAQVSMYCISFSSKFFVHGYGVYYQNFESAGLVYRFTLGMEVDLLAKRPICSQAVAKLVPKNLVRCISLPEAEGTHLRLFITAYEIFDKGQISIRAVIFDLNQWYRDQMPEEGVSSCIDSIDLDSKSLWHLQLDPSSLSLYQCVRPQEQHFYPTAFDFQVWCIEEEGIRCLEKLGLQTQWLRNMTRVGSKALIEPTQVFLGALAAGLLPSFVDPPDPEDNNEVEERSFVLTICLENRIIMVIEDCVKDWNNGGYTVRGCTIQFLLDWLWNLHRIYKGNGNKLCIPLFDQSGMKFDVSEKRSLQHCKSLLCTVQSVYTNIVNRYKNMIIISGLEEKLTAMALVRLYFDCCLKLISVNLLPEPNDQGRPSDSLTYHFDNINTYAINRRKEGPFLGDTLLGNTDAEKQWLEEGGTGRYPPPTIQSVLRFCLHPSPSMANKMSLLLYLFMDVINSYTPIRSQPVLDRIKNFQHLMRISEVQYKIVAGCWYFDHSMFDEGVDLLFDPRVLCVDLSEDQHRGILHLLASEGQEKLALQYLRLKSPTLNLPNDLRMELNLLLSNGLVNEAFLFQRKHPEMRETLLIEFFEGCIERKQLGQVFGLNLDLKEETTLMKYLRSSGLKEKGDLQVLLLLSKAKYTEAMFLNDKLNSSINGPKSRIETDTRDMIVRGITGSLNTITRHIANEMKTYRPPPAGSYPRPLSSLIKVQNGPDGPLCQTDSKVLLSAVAKSTRHLSDFVNSFESGQRRKREEQDTEVEFENEPSRKRLKLLDTALETNKVSSLTGKWLTSPKPSASQNRDVMELVGTPLVKKRGKRFSPQSRPSSILKGKTPEKSFITEDFGETPKKTIRFTLPENEVQITARKPLRDNETVSNKYSKMTVDSDDECATPITEEISKPLGLGKHVSARKPLHGDSLINSVRSHDSPSVLETIKDRLRSSAKKKVLEEGVNWHKVAEESKPRVLFTQGVSKITSVTKRDKTSSSTPMSQVLLDITVTSDEKKYLDSPSRGEENSPVTEALFNTTLLPKVLFPSVNNENELKQKLPEEASEHVAFLERYKKLRNKNIESSNTVQILDKENERGTRFEEQSFRDACTKKTVELFKSSKTISITKTIDKDLSFKKESISNKNILKESDNESHKQSTQHKLELPIDKEDLSNESLLEEQVCSNEIQKESLLTENESQSEHILVNEDELFQDIESSFQENNPLLEDDAPQCKEDEIISENQEKENEWSSCVIPSSLELEENSSLEESIVDNHNVCEYDNIKETTILHNIISKDETLNKSRAIEIHAPQKSNSENKKDSNLVLNSYHMLKKGAEMPDDSHCNITETYVENKSKEVSSDSKNDIEEVIDIVSDDEDDDEDKQSYDESLTGEETEEISGGSSEEVEEEMSEKEENESDNEGSLPDVSSISSDEDDVEHSDESEFENKKGQTIETPIFILSDDSEDETSKNEKKVSDVEGEELKTSSQSEKCDEDVSDTEIFGLKCDNMEEENSEDDMWIGLDDKECIENKNKKKSKPDSKCNDNDKQETENTQKSLVQVDLGNQEKESGGYKKSNLKTFDSPKFSHKNPFLGSNHPSMIKDEHDVLKNVILNAAENKSILEQDMPESSIFQEGSNCDNPPTSSNSISDQLSEQELLENSASVQYIKGGKVASENKEEVLSPVKEPKIDTVEEPTIEAVSVEMPIITSVCSISEEKEFAEESEPVSLPSIVEDSSLNNEDSQKCLDNAEVDSDLREDFQSIERNWTQQIEEEMKQDNVLLKIESSNNDSVNIPDKQSLSDESSESNSKECKVLKKSEVVSSVQTFEVELSENSILTPKKLRNLSKGLNIGNDISIKDNTNLSVEVGDILDKDKISQCDKSECVLTENEGKYNNDNLFVADGSLKGIIVKEDIVCDSGISGSTKEANLKEFKVSTEELKKNSVVILEESDKGELSKEKATVDDTKNDSDNSKVSLLDAEIDNHQTLKEGIHINISKDKNDSQTPVTVLPSQESLIIHSYGSYDTLEKKIINLEVSSTNILSTNPMSDISLNTSTLQSVISKIKGNATSPNKTESLSSEKNASFLACEKSKLRDDNVSEISLTSEEEENNKYSDKSLSPAEKTNSPVLDYSHTTVQINKNDSLSVSKTPSLESRKLNKMMVANEETHQNIFPDAGNKKSDSENATEIYVRDHSKISDKGSEIVISDTIMSSQEVIIKSSCEASEVQPTNLTTASGNIEESTDVKTLGRICEQPAEKYSSNFTKIDDKKVLHNINEVPSSSEDKVECSKIVGTVPPEQEDLIGNGTDDKALVASQVTNDDSVINNQVSNSPPSITTDTCQLNVVREQNFESPVLNYNTEGENLSQVHSIVCETSASVQINSLVVGTEAIQSNHEINTTSEDNAKHIVHDSDSYKDEKVNEENISPSIDKDAHPGLDHLDHQLNNAKMDVYNDSFSSDALISLKKDTNYDIKNIKSPEVNAKLCSETIEKNPTEKSFFFGKEDIETYIRSTKATFQIGSRVSLPEEDDPIDPMEVAMIEDEDKNIKEPSSVEPEIELSLHLSPERPRKPTKVDQGIVTENSYLQRRARKLSKSAKKPLIDESCNKDLKNKIISGDYTSNVVSVEKELKCISTQTADGVLDEIELSGSEEELIDYTKISGPSRKSVDQKRKITRRMRQSSEPPLTYQEELRRKSSISAQKSDGLYDLKEEHFKNKKRSQRLPQEPDIKGILKNKDKIEIVDDERHKAQSKVDHLPVRRSRRLSECSTDINELKQNINEKDEHIRSQRKSRGYSEEPDFYRINSYKDKESAGYNSSENEKEASGKDGVPKHRRSRRHSEEPEMRTVDYKNLDKRMLRASTNIDDDFLSRRRSRRFSEEPTIVNKYADGKRRISKNTDSTSEETEIRGILKKSSKGNCKTSLASETISDLKPYEGSDSRQRSRKLRSQSEEPELQEIPKKKSRQSRRSSYTYESAVDFHSQVEEIPVDNIKIEKFSEGTEIQSILKKKRSNKSRSSLLSEVDEGMKISHRDHHFERSKESRKHSEGEVQGILKNNKTEYTSSDKETIKLKLLTDVPERSRRSRRYSEEPEMLRTKTKIERRASQSSDINNEINLHEGRREGIRHLRRHSEEPEVRGIFKKSSNAIRKRLSSTETADDFKLQLEDDLPYESRTRSEEADVKGILKKSKSSKRRNSNASETDNKGLIHLERDSLEHKNSHSPDSYKDGKKVINFSNKTDSIGRSSREDSNFDEEHLLTKKNKLKNQTCSYVSHEMAKMVTDANVEPKKESQHSLHPRLQTEETNVTKYDSEHEHKEESDNKDINSLSHVELVSEKKRASRSFHLVLPEEDSQSNMEESPAKLRKTSSSSAIGKEESEGTISQQEEGIRNIRKSLRKTPDKKEINAKIMDERKRKAETENLKFVPKRLEYSDDESPEKKKSRSLIDFPIKRNSRLPRPTLEDIREEDEDVLKKKKKALDDFHLEEMKKKATSKKPSVSKLVIGDSDVDSDVSTPELWKKELTKEKRLTRTQQKVFLMNQQLTSVSEVESPSTSSPRRSIRKKADLTDSPLKTPTRSSLRLQKKPPSETD